MASNPHTIQLWRRCLRCCRAMEPSMGNYYHGFAREHIVAHKEEDDQERLAHLLNKGEQNLRFVLRKYKMIEPRPPGPPLTTTTATTKTRRRRSSNTTPPSRAAGGRGAFDLAGEESSSGTDDSAWTPGR